jgi:hypothetical protein
MEFDKAIFDEVADSHAGETTKRLYYYIILCNKNTKIRFNAFYVASGGAIMHFSA